VVFCVPKSNQLSEEQVQKTCTKWLPAFMVPTEVHILAKLPYLASGKADRRALKEKNKASREATDAGDKQVADSDTRYVMTQAMTVFWC